MSALLALYAPSMELIIIAIFASTLPVGFFVWLNWWLSSIKDENPEDAVREQAKADKEHIRRNGGDHGHGHGHAHV